MLGQPRIKLTDLAPLCRRLATQLAAGVDARRAWSREADIARGRDRRPMREVSEAVNQGSTMAEAMTATGEFFPTLFRELVDVGEQSGHSAEVFRQLSGHYDHLIVMRRDFRGAITWPVIQLFLALTIVGGLIWVMGMLGLDKHGKPLFDILGLGLYGTHGLVVYLTFLVCVVGGLWFLYQAIRRGLLWTRPLQAAIMRIPKLGTALDTLAMSRLSWSLHVTFESGMDLRRALALSLRSTHNARYTTLIEPVWQSIRAGQELYEALERTGVFPRSFIDAMEVGERSGRMSETLAILSQQYQDEARAALAMLTKIAGFGVWMLVAALIVSIIFQVVGQYVNMINNAVNGRFPGD
jgi:type II secretory pathway component PulF